MKPKKGIRYVVAKGVEAEHQPGSQGCVLRNLLDITKKREIDSAEYEALIAAQDKYIQLIGPNTRFTARIICDMHRVWLGGMYLWAGKYRTVELQKGAFKWPPAYLVDQNMKALEDNLLHRNTPCRPGPVQDVARCMAEVHADLLLIHPFREGNGRLARWLADLMALQAGYPAPEYNFEGREQKKTRKLYLEAVTRGYAQDYTPLTSFFADAIATRLEKRKRSVLPKDKNLAPSKIED